MRKQARTEDEPARRALNCVRQPLLDRGAARSIALQQGLPILLPQLLAFSEPKIRCAWFLAQHNRGPNIVAKNGSIGDKPDGFAPAAGLGRGIDCGRGLIQHTTIWASLFLAASTAAIASSVTSRPSTGAPP